MGLRICLVTPFAWSQPHDVNEHVAGVAEELRKLGHAVTILASSNRARDLAAGRRALLDGLDTEVVALGPAVPISRRSRIGVPVGSRANLSLALALGHFDVLEWRPTERPLVRSVLRALEELPGWELVLLRTKPLTGRPTIPRALRDRVSVRTARDGRARAALLAEAAIFVPAVAGLGRV